MKLLSIKEWSQGVHVWLFIDLLYLANFIRVIGSTVNFEDSLIDSCALPVDYGGNLVVEILVCSEEEVALLNDIEDWRVPTAEPVCGRSLSYQATHNVILNHESQALEETAR